MFSATFHEDVQKLAWNYGHVCTGEDRHNVEILAFYVGLLLDLRRAPITIGRRVNISKEMLKLLGRNMTHFVPNFKIIAAAFTP